MNVCKKISVLIAALSILLFVGCAPPPDVKGVEPPQPQPEENGVISTDKNFYLIMDGSGSMGESSHSGSFGSKIKAAKWAAREFVTKRVSPDVNLGLYVFDGNGERERVALGQNNREAILKEIDAISATSGTPLNTAIKRGVNALVKQRSVQLGYGEFYIVVVTDGEATDGDTKDAVSYAQKGAIPIITIGFGLNKQHPLAKDSLSYRNATNPDELLQAMQETQGESTYFDSTTFKK